MTTTYLADGTKHRSGEELTADELLKQRDALLGIVEQWESWRELGDAAAEQPDKVDCDFVIEWINGAPNLVED